MRKKIYFVLIGILWLAMIAGIIAAKEVNLRSGVEVLLETEPVDPRDLFRGDYVVLSYDISNVTEDEYHYYYEGLSRGDDIYLALQKIGKYWEEDYLTTYEPTSESYYIKGKVTYADSDSVRVDYGIESYFVPEGEGRVIERTSSDVDVLVSLKKGKGIIKEIYIDDEPLTFE